MRRFFALVAIVASLGCGSDILGPVQTTDGHWTGTQNGYSLSMILAQNGNIVTGSASFGGLLGVASGTVEGTFTYPSINLTISISGVQDVVYKGTMSQSQAKIVGQLNGSGFNNLELDVALQK